MFVVNDVFFEKWPELKNEVRQRWGNLTEDDVAQLMGNTEQLVNALLLRYGCTRRQAEIEVYTWLHSLA